MQDGSELRWLRECAGLSVGEAAKLLHVSSLELRLWEEHAPHVPASILGMIREVYNVHQKPEVEPAREEYVAGVTEMEIG
jgi:predicted transcriptional regulator